MFSTKTRDKLKYYVYLYIDPRTDQPFYVGKGQGNRCFSHLKDNTESDKARIINELEKLGLKPRIELLKYKLNEIEALLVEATAIDLIGVKNLANLARGHGSRHGARAGVEEIGALLDAKEADITDPVMLITISRAYRHGMSMQELYDVTRSAWKAAPLKHNAKYGLSIYQNIVREVFEIIQWVPGGTTIRGNDDTGHPPARPKRWEFVGRVAEDKIRKKYFGKSVASYYKKGAQNPIMYVNC